MNPSTLDPQRDMPAVAALLARSGARGGLYHPGGIQWWLRELGRDGFEAHVWRDADRAVAFLMIDRDFVIAVSEDREGAPDQREVLAWAEHRMAASGRDSLSVSLFRTDPLLARLLAEDYEEDGGELELMVDIDAKPFRAELPPGFRFTSLAEVGDEAFIELHRAAWSDVRPSPYRDELHNAVKSMPDFRPESVPICIAPDGTPAAYCIGWADPLSATLEIEPLGTHRQFRRLGLARAVVHEITRRAWREGLRHVLVWNDPVTNPAAYGLYTSAGMTARRQVVRLTRPLARLDAPGR